MMNARVMNITDKFVAFEGEQGQAILIPLVYEENRVRGDLGNVTEIVLSDGTIKTSFTNGFEMVDYGEIAAKHLLGNKERKKVNVWMFGKLFLLYGEEEARRIAMGIEEGRISPEPYEKKLFEDEGTPEFTDRMMCEVLPKLYKLKTVGEE